MGKCKVLPPQGYFYALRECADCLQGARAGSGILLDNAIRTTFTLLRLLPLLTLDCKRKRLGAGQGTQGTHFALSLLMSSHYYLLLFLHMQQGAQKRTWECKQLTGASSSSLSLCLFRTVFFAKDFASLAV